MGSRQDHRKTLDVKYLFKVREVFTNEAFGITPLFTFVFGSISWDFYGMKYVKHALNRPFVYRAERWMIEKIFVVYGTGFE